MRIIDFFVDLIVRPCGRLVDWCYPPTDFGKHGILLNRGDHFSPITDDEMWDAMSIAEEQLTESWWEQQFLRGFEIHGDAIFAMH